MIAIMGLDPEDTYRSHLVSCAFVSSEKDVFTRHVDLAWYV